MWVDDLHASVFSENYSAQKEALSNQLPTTETAPGVSGTEFPKHHNEETA